jgi:cytochrome P450
MSSMTQPRDPIAAVTHPDPYPYYARLVAERPLYRDEALGLWVASSGAAVEAVLSSELGRVRPPAEPVPKAILGSPAGELFRHLVRMNDGAGHCPLKAVVSTALQSIDAAEIAHASDASARRLGDELLSNSDRDRLTKFCFALPVHAMASLLGVPRDNQGAMLQWTDDYVSALAPGADPATVERGKAAAGHLLETAHYLLADESTGRTQGLLAALARAAARAGIHDRQLIAANGMGFLSQTYEATAGLIGNTLVALGAHEDVRRRAIADPAILAEVIEEVLRYDPPVHNTRRFLARSGNIGGADMAEGDVVLVVLAAAGRDPAVNPDPARFDPSRRNRKLFTFGAGGHACPGASIATAIAAAGVAEVGRRRLALDAPAGMVRYRASHNMRIPLFGMGG